LEGIEDISFMDLTAEDVVRHRLISDIVSAYEAYDEARNSAVSQTRQIR
jgi:phosphate starvation-inducible PhoH-like protein